MLTTVMLPLALSCHICVASEFDMVSAAQISKALRCAVVASYPHGKRVAPGPDHGGDPDDEHHDYGLPANQHAGDGYPSDDPYNGSTPNNKDHPFRPY